MTRITKTIATNVAEKMVLPLKREIETKTNELNSFSREAYMESIPEKVRVFYDENPELRSYFKTTSYSYIRGEGIGDYEFRPRLNPEVPYSSDAHKKISSLNARKIVSMRREIEKLEKQQNDAIKSITVALIALGTYNKVSLEFPEAYQFLPNPVTTAVAINMKDVRSMVNSINGDRK